MLRKSSAQAQDIAMKGGGYYSLATKGAKDVIDHATPLVLDALTTLLPELRDGTLTISDMGCADGGTSLAMLESVTARIRDEQPGRPVMIVYSDQPRNDYNALLQTVHGADQSPTALSESDQVFIVASATSFYRPILPPGSLHLGFSATAMHWLSQKPSNLRNHVHMVGASSDELALFTEQAKQDWETILLHRAAELAPGGKLVLVNFCRDPDGHYLGNTGGQNMFNTFNTLWQGLVATGRVTEAEYEQATLPQYYNTVDEFSAPLTDPASSVYKAGLRLDHIDTRTVECPYAADFRDHGDAQRFAEAYLPTLRSWSESTFFAALDQQRTPAERQQIIDEFYATYQSQVAANPTGHAMDYVHAYMVISKQANG